MCLRVKVFVLLLFCSVGAAWGQTDVDARLSKKVTIDCTNVRLHTALERISDETGVGVRTGQDGSDWTVRDLPALVCARDLPLGLLLKAIADTNHLLLSNTKVNDVITYRIWRDAKRQKEIDEFEQKRRAAAQAAASWDWDSLSKLSDVPEDKLTPIDDDHVDTLRVLKPVSNILNELGAAAKRRILDGETIVLGLINANESIKPDIESAFWTFWKSAEKYAAENGQLPPTPFEDQIDRSFIKIQLGDWGLYPDSLNIELWSGAGGIVKVGHNEIYDISRVRKYISDLPSRPDVLAPTMDTYDLDSEYAKIPLGFVSTGGPAFLDTKINVPAPEKPIKPSYFDLMRGLSKATGYSIVAEGKGARSAMPTMMDEQKLPMLFDRDVTVREILGLSWQTEWYMNEDKKILIGRDPEWIMRVKALVPEKLLLGLHHKYEDDGIDLDELEPLSRLTHDQIREWIGRCPDFPEVQGLYGVALDVSGDNPWRMYFALASDEKKAAKSGSPVPMEGFDIKWLCRMLRQAAARELNQFFVSGSALTRPAVWMTDIGLFIGSDSAPDLRIWIERYNLPQPLTGKHSYVLHVESGTKDGFSITKGLYQFFPIRSRQEKESESTGNK